MKTCSIDGCDRMVAARGWCMRHWKRWRRYGDPTFVTKMMDHADRCAVDGCERAYGAGGYCDAHYSRVVTHGSPLADIPIGGPGASRLFHVEPMPCRLDQNAIAAMQDHGVATLVTAEGWEMQAAAWMTEAEDDGYQRDYKRRAWLFYDAEWAREPLIEAAD